MAIRVWPTRGAGPSALKNEPASRLKALPVNAAASTSTISASAVPFASPIGCMDPSKAASGSVVGWPSLSKAQPSGISPPDFLAFMTLPRATTDSDRSMTRGGPFSRGVAKAIGLVPNRGSRPPQGAIALGVFATIRPIIPAAAIFSTCTDNAPQWWELAIAMTHTPMSRARGRPTSSAFSSAG